MITIETNYQNELVLSSSLNEFKVKTSYDYLLLTLTDEEGTAIFSEKFWVYNGEVKFVDLASLIETDMRTKGKTVAKYLFTASWDWEGDEEDTTQPIPRPDARHFEESLKLNVLYCEDVNLSEVFPDDFTKENFLTTLQQRRLSPEFNFSLHFYEANIALKEYEVTMICRILGEDSAYTYSKTESIESDNNIYSIPLNATQMKETLKQHLGHEGFELLAFSVVSGKRYATFTIDESLRYGETFYFRNMFNAADCVTVPAETESQTDVSRSIAVMPEKSMFYDRTVKKSFQVQTGPLIHPEAEFLEQLVSSYQVYRAIFKGYVEGLPQFTMKEVMITESDVKYSDNDSTQQVKFTWRYADNRPGVILDMPYRIFTNEYIKVFS